MFKLWRSLEGRAEDDQGKIADVILQLAISEEVRARPILGVRCGKADAIGGSCPCERGQEMATPHGFNGV